MNIPRHYKIDGIRVGASPGAEGLRPLLQRLEQHTGPATRALPPLDDPFCRPHCLGHLQGTLNFVFTRSRIVLRHIDLFVSLRAFSSTSRFLLDKRQEVLPEPYDC